MNNDFFKKLPLILFFVFIFAPIFGKYALPLIVFGVIFYFVFSLFKINNLNNLFSKTKNMSNIVDVGSIEYAGKVKNFLFLFIGAILLLWLFFSSIIIVDAGETGVYSLFGNVKDKELSSGFHLVIPLAKVTKMSIRTEEYTMSIAKERAKEKTQMLFAL